MNIHDHSYDTRSVQFRYNKLTIIFFFWVHYPSLFKGIELGLPHFIFKKEVHK